MTKRRFIFSMRTGLEVIAVIAVVCAFLVKNNPRRIQADALLDVRVTGTLAGIPIDGLFPVEKDGAMTLGAPYGSVNVLGQTAVEAEATIAEQLSRVVASPEVSVTLIGNSDTWRRDTKVRDLEQQLRKLRSKAQYLQEQMDAASLLAEDVKSLMFSATLDDTSSLAAFRGFTTYMVTVSKGALGKTEFTTMFYSCDAELRSSDFGIVSDDEHALVGIIHKPTRQLVFAFNRETQAQFKKTAAGFPPDIVERLAANDAK